MNHADVKMLAYEYLKKIEDSKQLKGKSLEAKVGCVILYAARNTNKHKTISDVLNYVNSTKQELRKCVKNVKELLGFVATPPSAIVDSVCLKLDLPPDVLRAAKITAGNF